MWLRRRVTRPFASRHTSDVPTLLQSSHALSGVASASSSVASVQPPGSGRHGPVGAKDGVVSTKAPSGSQRSSAPGSAAGGVHPRVVSARASLAAPSRSAWWFGLLLLALLALRRVVRRDDAV